MDDNYPPKSEKKLKKERKKSSKDIEERKSMEKSSAMKEIKLKREQKRKNYFPPESSTVSSGSAKTVNILNKEDSQENLKQTSISHNEISVNSKFGSFSKLYNPILMFIRSETFISLAQRVWLTLLSEVIVSFISKICRGFLKNNDKRIQMKSEDSNFKPPVFILANGSGPKSKVSSSTAEQDRATQVTGVSIEEFIRQLSGASRRPSSSGQDLNPAESNENINSLPKNNLDILNEGNMHDKLHPEYEGSKLATLDNGHEHQHEQHENENANDKSSTTERKVMKGKEEDKVHCNSFSKRDEESSIGERKKSNIDDFTSELTKASTYLKKSVDKDVVNKRCAPAFNRVEKIKGTIHNSKENQVADEHDSEETKKKTEKSSAPKSKKDEKLKERNRHAKVHQDAPEHNSNETEKSSGPKSDKLEEQNRDAKEDQGVVEHSGGETKKKTEKSSGPTSEKDEKLEERKHDAKEHQGVGELNSGETKKKTEESSAPTSAKDDKLEERKHDANQGASEHNIEETNKPNSVGNYNNEDKNIDLYTNLDSANPNDRNQRSVPSRSSNKNKNNKGNKFITQPEKYKNRLRMLDSQDELRKLQEITKGQTSKTADDYPD